MIITLIAIGALLALWLLPALAMFSVCTLYDPKHWFWYIILGITWPKWVFKGGF